VPDFQLYRIYNKTDALFGIDTVHRAVTAAHIMQIEDTPLQATRNIDRTLVQSRPATQNLLPQREANDFIQSEHEVQCFGDEEQTQHTHDVENTCHLCTYHGDRSTAAVIALIMDSVSHISIDSLVDQSKYLLDHLEVTNTATKAEIRIHITRHILHPRVKLAIQIQELCKMQREVAKCCVVRDVESGERTVNTQAMRVYLSLSSQVSGAYKTCEDKLLFNGAVLEN
jgi:hypothetical protein